MYIRSAIRSVVPTCKKWEQIISGELKKKKIVLVFLFIFFIPYFSLTQDSLSGHKVIEMTGYLKTLQGWNFSPRFDQMRSTDLLHHRLNTRLQFSQHLMGAISFRTRWIWGDQVRMTTDHSKMLRNQQEWMNLSVTWKEQDDWVLHTNTERLWIEYTKGRWNLRAGRQRINWSMTTTWNPADLFNTYNFLDVDYEERPGSDAVLVQYNIKPLSQIEIAIDPGKTNHQRIIAMRYTFHSGKTDHQVILGSYRNRMTIGTAWAGSIGETGWKGEMQYFGRSRTDGQRLNMCMEADHAFHNGWYVQAAYLWNSSGISDKMQEADSLIISPTPLQLMPTRNNITVHIMKELTPLFSTQCSIVYAPGTNLLLLLPRLQYSLGKDLDADLVWQSFFTERNRFQSVGHAGFIRLRWSY